MGNNHLKTRRIPLALQRMAMNRTFPTFRFAGRYNRAVWIGPLTPTDLCETYEVKIEYRMGVRPIITVVSPKLHKRDGAKGIPHVYAGDHPCVYFPDTGDWHSGKLIATTIVPWLSLWLYFYEVWHATGKWLGGGIDHGDGIKS